MLDHFIKKVMLRVIKRGFMEGVKYASKEFQPQQSLLSSLISSVKKRGDGGTLNQGQISVVGEKPRINDGKTGC